MARRKRIDDLVPGLPSVAELKRYIAANLKERRFLGSLLRLAQKREDVEHAKQDVEGRSRRAH
jgi:hypothetical protein